MDSGGGFGREGRTWVWAPACAGVTGILGPAESYRRGLDDQKSSVGTEMPSKSSAPRGSIGSMPMMDTYS